MTEARMMSRARDEFVLNIFGVCIEPESGYYALVLPYMSQGSLLQYVRSMEID